MIPETTQRVAQQTSAEINEKIRQKTEMNIKAYGCSPELIEHRLKELENEWDIERSLEANGSTLLLAGVVLSLLSGRRWILLPALVGGFCLQHALKGWCPPLDAFRRLGVRTSREIEEERSALKALRGDFKNIPENAQSSDGFEQVLQAVRR